MTSKELDERLLEIRNSVFADNQDKAVKQLIRDCIEAVTAVQIPDYTDHIGAAKKWGVLDTLDTIQSNTKKLLG